MHDMADIHQPHDVQRIAELIHAEGGRAFVVGGCVRDHLMGIPIKDWDLEVYGVHEKRLAKLLRKIGPVNAVGRAFGVLKVRSQSLGEIDVSIPRRDSNAGPGHKGIHVEGDPDMAPEEAVCRRDLTINAIMVNLVTGELFDPRGGVDDINAGLLRAVDETTFLEDPLRALRVVQFAARLGFKANEQLLSLCERAGLDELPAERVQAEWGKLLLKGRQPSIGLNIARKTGITARVFPELVDDPNTDTLLDRAVLLRPMAGHEGRQWSLMLHVWLHQTQAEGWEPTLDRLWLHKWQGYSVRDNTLASLGHWLDPIDSDSDLRNLSTRAELRLTLLGREAITQDPACSAALAKALSMGIAEQKPTPVLQGRHLKELGVQPGPQMGVILKRVYQLQLDGLVTDLEQAKAAINAPS